MINENVFEWIVKLTFLISHIQFNLTWKNIFNNFYFFLSEKIFRSTEAATHHSV